MRPFPYPATVGIFSLLAGILAALCLYIGALSVEYNFDAFSNPLLALHYAAHYKQAYWFLILDLSGYYLLLLPVIFYVHRHYKSRSPWMPLFTFSGAAYVLTGAIGSAILAASWPALMQDYLAAAGTTKDSVTLLFKTITLPVTGGLWNGLEVAFAAVWWMGTGALMRREHRITGWLAILTGFCCGLDFLGTTLHLSAMAEAGLNGYLLLHILWSVTMGSTLLRRNQQQAAVHPTLNPAI